MNKETNTIISNLEGCSDMFDYWLTPKASNLLVSYIKELQQENKQLQKELEEYKNPIKYFKYANKNVVEENKQLKDNWNELKEYIKECLEAIDTIQKLTGNAIENYTPRILTYKQIKNKMQELEQGSDNQ